jgi:FixJ family two-component response regulator
MHDRANDEPIIYIVDDEERVREGLKSLFSSVRLDAQAFSTAPEFLACTIADKVSCLILDVRLPGMSGLDFQAQLAKANLEIPIIFITGHGDIPMTVKAMKAGAVEFLTKPLREQDLLDTVRVALDRDRARRQAITRDGDLRARYNTLSERERQVIKLVSAGLMNKQSAAEMGLSEITVKVHRHHAMKKLMAKSVADLVRIVERLGV